MLVGLELVKSLMGLVCLSLEGLVDDCSVVSINSGYSLTVLSYPKAYPAKQQLAAPISGDLSMTKPVAVPGSAMWHPGSDSRRRSP